MELRQYLQSLRRHRTMIVLLTVVGLALGFFTAPDADGPDLYEATHTLLAEPSLLARSTVLPQAALLVTVGDVPDQVAARLEVDDDAALASQVQATADPEVGSLEITATSTEPERAELLADAFAEELIVVLAGGQDAEFNATRESQLSTINQFSQELVEIDGMVAAAQEAGEDTSALAGRRSSVSNQYRLALSALAQLEAQAAPNASLQTLETATARPAGEGSLQAPDSQVGRMVILGTLGLALGVGLSLLLNRLDTKLRTKQGTEEALGVPVLAEIPPLPRSHRHGNGLLAGVDTASPYVESHRNLRSVLAFSWGGHERTDDNGISPDSDRQVILVVSPGAAEGKTTTVANLAAMFAELGKSVLVISADFRRPRIHALFGETESPGLTDMDDPGSGSMKLGNELRTTSVPGVRLLASGPAVDNPTELLRVTCRLMRSARELVDVVIVDSPPLLVANDATELSSAADSVLILARAGSTTREAAQGATEMLAKVDAPVVGAALIGAVDMPSAGYYYRSRYYGVRSPRGRMARLLRRDRRPNVATSAPTYSARAQAEEVAVTRPPANGSTKETGSQRRGKGKTSDVGQGDARSATQREPAGAGIGDRQEK